MNAVSWHGVWAKERKAWLHASTLSKVDNVVQDWLSSHRLQPPAPTHWDLSSNINTLRDTSMKVIVFIPFKTVLSCLAIIFLIVDYCIYCAALKGTARCHYPVLSFILTSQKLFSLKDSSNEVNQIYGMQVDRLIPRYVVFWDRDILTSCVVCFSNKTIFFWVSHIFLGR